MPLNFVRYSPGIETVDLNLDRLLEQIIAFWEKTVRESPVVEGSGRAVRGAHAKTYGVVKAEVQILRNVTPAYAQGIYAKPGRHGALTRFSSASTSSFTFWFVCSMLEETKHLMKAPWNKKIKTAQARDRRAYRSHMR